MRVYIAGPLFNDEQVELIKRIENKLTERGYEYFSPRSLGVFDRNPSMTSQFDKVTIVERNKEELNKADRLVAILSRDKNGHMDIGTLWEIGHFASRFVSEMTEAWTPMTLMNRYIYPVYDPKDKDLVDELFGNLLTLVAMVRKSYTSINQTPRADFINLFAFDNLSTVDYDKIHKSDLDFNVVDLSVQDVFDWTERTVILIDDRPSLLFILLGIMTGLIESCSYRWSIGTASVKGYGSNIMIAHSTDYHVQIDTTGSVATIVDTDECNEMN